MLQELPVPDITYAEQLKFASVVRAQARLNDQQREGLRQAQHLFDSLLGRLSEPENLGERAAA